MYVTYYHGSPSLYISLGFPFIPASFLLFPLYDYRLCSHACKLLVVFSMGPLSSLDPKPCHCPCPLKKEFLHFQCAYNNSGALVCFGHKNPCLVINFQYWKC